MPVEKRNANAAPGRRGKRSGENGPGGRSKSGGGAKGAYAPQDDFAEAVLQVRRVAKVIKGGRRLSFSALVVVGDRAGKVGIALGKSREVSSAISKAYKRARKNMVDVPLYKTTIPFTVQAKHSASKVLLRSASKGTGVIAGGSVRAVLDALGVKDVLAKSLGSPNPGNVARATMEALQTLSSASHIAKLRGKSIKELIGGVDAES
ncbi:30S ribosomal protein S5 [bacterium]|jgi:small subunit ribosomal protein S5|nr:30S ribosomal protein S5 [bacterium]